MNWLLLMHILVGTITVWSFAHFPIAFFYNRRNGPTLEVAWWVHPMAALSTIWWISTALS